MFRPSRKFIAVLLAIWLPLFGGNALAASIAMQAMGGDRFMVAQQDKQHAHHAAATQHAQHTRLAANQDQSAGNCDQQNSHHGQQNSGHKNCGVCHLACCGYMVAASIEVMDAQPSARLFTPLSTQFQSITSAPLDPPPLSRV